jgi:hypothetical protein
MNIYLRIYASFPIVCSANNESSRNGMAFFEMKGKHNRTRNKNIKYLSSLEGKLNYSVRRNKERNVEVEIKVGGRTKTFNDSQLEIAS